jgi:hypothetical protein
VVVVVVIHFNSSLLVCRVNSQMAKDKIRTAQTQITINKTQTKQPEALSVSYDTS